MSVLENTGVMALGHIAGQASGGLAAELRRRMYGSGIVVVSAAERGNRWVVPS
jgi:hypothetical protein